MIAKTQRYFECGLYKEGKCSASKRIPELYSKLHSQQKRYLEIREHITKRIKDLKDTICDMPNSNSREQVYARINELKEFDKWIKRE